MRRLAGIFAAVVLLAPTGVRLATANVDIEALRCAIACGHAATPGAACCPMARGGRETGAALAACPQGDPQSIAPSLPAQPGLIGAMGRLAAPEGGSMLERVLAVAPQSPSKRPPDHVPLLLS